MSRLSSKRREKNGVARPIGSGGRTKAILITLLNLLLLFAVHTGLTKSVSTGYAGDSIYTLSTMSAIGLAALTVLLAVFILSLSWWKSGVLIKRSTQPFILLVDLSLTVLLFWISASVVPQLYYQYYRLVIPGLPEQWVVHNLIPWEKVALIMQMSADQGLSDHASGLTLWLMLLNVVGAWTLHVFIDSWWLPRRR